MDKALISLFFLATIPGNLPAQAGTTYVGANEADTLFSQITQEDMDIIRTKKILIAGRSYSLNMLEGITRPANRDAMYALDYRRSIINRHYDAHGDMPTDIFSQYNVNHYLVPLSD